MSLKLPIIIKAKAPENPEEINEFVKELLSLIGKNTFLHSLIEQNCKLVLIELITNAIKHVKENENILEVYLDNPLLKISKIDNGPKFQIEKETLNPKRCTNNYLTEKLDQNTIFFRYQDQRKEEELDSFPENFGFEIITKASKSFIYKYDAEKKENIFTAVIQS